MARTWAGPRAALVGLGLLAAGFTTAAAAPPPLAAAALPGFAAPPMGEGRIEQADPDLPKGYLEQEFLVSGTGRLFRYDAEGEAAIQADGLPWTTRVIIRRPADPRRFSGWAYVEPLHPEIGSSFAWRQSREYFARKGDAWVGITTTRNLILHGGLDPLGKLRKADPVRYAALGFGPQGNEGGLDWDVIAAVGRLVKSGGLLAGSPVRKTVFGGWSGAGALTLFFTNTFAMRERLPDGGPIFDAVLLGEPGWYPRINGAAGDIMPYDIRQRPAKLDVPVISLHSSAPIEFGMPFRPRPDSDGAMGRYRAFEIAGANHRGAREPMNGDLGELCGAPSSDFPVHHYFSLSIDHLKRWADGGGPPPASRSIEIDRYGLVKTDADGNVLGGVRSVALDVPVARHYQTHDARLVECRGGARMVSFSREELIRRYGDHAGYVAKVRARSAELVAQGWLLPEDAAEIVAQAGAFRGFDSGAGSAR